VRLLIRGPALAASFKTFARTSFLLLGCVMLGGCVDVAGDPPNADAHPQFVRRGDANMAGATLAIVSVEGAPADLSGHFSQSLTDAAAARQIAVAAPGAAHYLARGYVTASPIEGGAAVDVVWDVFTPDKQRVQRISDTIAIKGSGDDAWAMVSDSALDSVAARCADDLAAYLSNTPDAAPGGAALSYAQ
jgi:hypothetical protein